MIEIEMPLPLFLALKTSDPGHPPVETLAESTFIEFFLKEKKRLYNFILKSVSFSEDANDIYQETALRAFKYFRKFDRKREFRPWIFSIAINEIKKYFRNRHRAFAGVSKIGKNGDSLILIINTEIE